MWAFAVLIVVGLGAFAFGIKELFTGERRPIVQAIAITAVLFAGNYGYGWDIRQEVLIFISLSVVGAIRFFEK